MAGAQRRGVGQLLRAAAAAAAGERPREGANRALGRVCAWEGRGFGVYVCGMLLQWKGSVNAEWLCSTLTTTNPPWVTDAPRSPLLRGDLLPMFLPRRATTSAFLPF